MRFSEYYFWQENVELYFAYDFDFSPKHDLIKQSCDQPFCYVSMILFLGEWKTEKILWTIDTL